MSRGANGAPAAVTVLKSRRALISAEALMERTGRNSGSGRLTAIPDMTLGHVRIAHHTTAMPLLG